MNIFGLAFILYVLKWSDGRGFWEIVIKQDLSLDFILPELPIKIYRGLFFHFLIYMEKFKFIE